jgi:hypothetical protein
MDSGKETKSDIETGANGLDYPLIHRLEQEGITIHNRTTPIYKYVTGQRAIEILRSNSLFYASCKAFNDPFEFHESLLDVNYDETLNKLKKELLEEGRPEMTSENLALLPGRIDALMNTSRAKLIGVFENTKSKLGIFCASTSPVSTLMWSHYADSHKGVCIGFRIKPAKTETKYTYLHVAYKDYIKSVPYDFNTPAENVFPLVYWMHVKSKVWEYEQEIRIINFKSNGLSVIDNMNITEIYDGVATPTSEINTIEAIIAEKRYPVAKRGKMNISTSSFDLEIGPA